jgi:hypothetical protein
MIRTCCLYTCASCGARVEEVGLCDPCNEAYAQWVASILFDRMHSDPAWRDPELVALVARRIAERN